MERRALSGIPAPFTGLAAERCRPAVDGGSWGGGIGTGEPLSRGFSGFGLSRITDGVVTRVGMHRGVELWLKPNCEKPRERGCAEGLAGRWHDPP